MRIRPEFWFCIVAVLLILSQCSYADDSVLTWSGPTQTESCSAAGPLTNLAGYRIYKMIADIPDPDVLEYTVTALAAGDHTFAATAYDEAGVESRLTQGVVKTSAGLFVTDDRAYIVAKINNGFLTVVAGTVPIGTECVDGDKVNGYNRVPTEAVTWSGTVTDVIAVAQCR